MEQRLQFVGWILFLLCAPLFLISALINGDVWSASASVVFGVGVVLFLVALRPKKKSGKQEPHDAE